MNMNGGPMTQASLEKPENVYIGKYTCSLKWKNKIYFIGGYDGSWGATSGQDQMRQISVLDKCQLERVGNLTVDMLIPSCHATANAVFLCFYGSSTKSDIDVAKRCYKGTSPLKVTERLDDTQYTHSRAGLSSSETHMIAVGSGPIWGSGNASPEYPSHSELEMLDLSTFKWVVKSPYPSHIDYPAGAATLYLKGRFYVFGGFSGYEYEWYKNRIAYYDPNTDVWAHGGFLGSNGEDLCSDCWYPGRNIGILPVNNDKLFVFNGRSEVCTYDGYAKYTCEDTSKDTINYGDIIDGYGSPIMKPDVEHWRDHFAYKHPIHHLFAVPSGYCN